MGLIKFLRLRRTKRAARQVETDNSGMSGTNAQTVFMKIFHGVTG